MSTNKTTELKIPKTAELEWICAEEIQNPHLPTVVAYSHTAETQMLNAILIVHKYCPLVAAQFSCPHGRSHDLQVSRPAVFTAVFPGRQSGRTQCLGCRQQGRDWRRPGAPASV